MDRSVGSPLSMTLLVTLLMFCLVECAVMQTSHATDELPFSKDDVKAASHIRPHNSLDSEEQKEFSFHPRPDIVHQLLQMTGRLRSNSERQQNENDSQGHSNEGLDEDEGTAASLRLLRQLFNELSEIESDTKLDSSSNPIKRTCRFNLGGHCATEEAVNMANQWHFFNSPSSPGRRRRAAVKRSAAAAASSLVKSDHQ